MLSVKIDQVYKGTYYSTSFTSFLYRKEFELGTAEVIFHN